MSSEYSLYSLSTVSSPLLLHFYILMEYVYFNESILFVYDMDSDNGFNQFCYLIMMGNQGKVSSLSSTFVFSSYEGVSWVA